MQIKNKHEEKCYSREMESTSSAVFVAGVVDPAPGPAPAHRGQVDLHLRPEVHQHP